MALNANFQKLADPLEHEVVDNLKDDLDQVLHLRFLLAQPPEDMEDDMRCGYDYPTTLHTNMI